MEVTSNSHQDTHPSYSLIHSIRAGHANPPNPGPSPSHLVIKVPTGKDGDSAQDGAQGQSRASPELRAVTLLRDSSSVPGRGPGHRGSCRIKGCIEM